MEKYFKHSKRLMLVAMLALLLGTMATAVLGCGEHSSPEKRSRTRDGELSARIDVLERRQLAILDSLRAMEGKIRVLQGDNRR